MSVPTVKTRRICLWPRGRPRTPEEIAEDEAREAQLMRAADGKPERVDAVKAHIRRRVKRDEAKRLNEASAAAAERRLAPLVPQFEASMDKLKREEKEVRARRHRGLELSGHEGNRQVSNRIAYDHDARKAVRTPFNVRHDVIEYMFAHNQISLAEKVAADRFREIYYLAAAPGARTVDFGAVNSGGAGSKTPVNDRMLFARETLDRVERLLGEDGYSLLVVAVSSAKTIAVIAAEMAGDRINKSKTAKKNVEWYFGERLREVLRKLVSFFSASAGNAGAMRSFIAPDAKPTNRPDLRGKTTA